MKATHKHHRLYQALQQHSADCSLTKKANLVEQRTLIGREAKKGQGGLPHSTVYSILADPRLQVQLPMGHALLDVRRDAASKSLDRVCVYATCA